MRSEAETQSVGAPANEIEITPEMIEAGLSELFSFDPDKDIPEEKCAAIYRAMARLAVL